MSQTNPQSSNSEIEQLKERIASLEEKLLRVSNIYRYETLQKLLIFSKNYPNVKAVFGHLLLV